jgi:SAM-dependent methyltransferase
VKDDRPSQYQTVWTPEGYLSGQHDTLDIWARSKMPHRLDGMSVLDIGCHTGAYLDEALLRGASKVTGVDEGKDYCEYTERTLLGIVEGTREVRIVRGHYPDETGLLGQHDVVLALSVVHHQEYPLRFLRALRADTRCYAWIEWELGTDGMVADEPVPCTPGAPFGRGYYPTRQAAIDMLTMAEFQSVQCLGSVRNGIIYANREMFLCQ